MSRYGGARPRCALVLLFCLEIGACRTRQDTATRGRAIQGGAQTALPAGTKFSIDQTDIAGTLQGEASLCSGIRFATGKVLTAAHCLDSAVGATISFIMDRDQGNAVGAAIGATGRALHPSLDLAVLFYDEPAAVTAAVGAVALTRPAERRYRRVGHATGRRNNDEEGAAGEYLESTLVAYHLTGEVEGRPLAAEEIATAWVANPGDSGGAYFGRFLTADDSAVFRPIAAAMMNDFVCRSLDGGPISSAPLDGRDNMMRRRISGPSFRQEFNATIYQSYDTGWIHAAAREDFPARSPTVTMLARDTVEGCLVGYDSTSGNAVCQHNPQHLGAYSTCTLTTAGHVGRAMIVPSDDGCNISACNQYQARLVSDCMAECVAYGRRLGRVFTAATCGYPQGPAFVCPKNAPTEADSYPARCICHNPPPPRPRPCWGRALFSASDSIGATSDAGVPADAESADAGVGDDAGGCGVDEASGSGEQVIVPHDIYELGEGVVDPEVLAEDLHQLRLNTPLTLQAAPTDEGDPPAD